MPAREPDAGQREPRRDGEPGEERDGHDLTVRAQAGHTLTATCGSARAAGPQNAHSRHAGPSHPCLPPSSHGHCRSHGGATPRRPDTRWRGPVVDIVVPVYNEETGLGASGTTAARPPQPHFPFTWPDHHRRQRQHRPDPGRSPGARSELDGVEVDPPGRKGSRACAAQRLVLLRRTVVAYMDVDLSTDLDALLPLVAPLDLRALRRGDRLPPRPRRRAWSAGPSASSSPAATTCSCGRRSAPVSPTPSAGSRRSAPTSPRGCCRWSRTTAGSSTPSCSSSPSTTGLRIHEIPVDWVDDHDSRVDILSTARADLAGMVRVGRSLALGRLPVAEIRGSFGRGRPGPSVAGVDTRLSGQLVRFTAIGVVSTLAYILLYALLRPGMGAQTANLLTLLVTAIANTTANRSSLSAVKGSSGAIRHQGQGLVVFVLGLALTSGALGLLGALGLGPTEWSRWPPWSPQASRPRRCASCCCGSGSSAAPVPVRRRDGPARDLARDLARAPERPGLGPTGTAESAGRGRDTCYLWNLGVNGWANSYYAAAVQAGSTNWKAFLFGSLDAAQRHHGGQARAVPMADGAVRADLRAQLMEHPGPAGAEGWWPSRVGATFGRHRLPDGAFRVAGAEALTRRGRCSH